MFHISKDAFDFTLGFEPLRLAGFWIGAVMLQKTQQRTVENQLACVPVSTGDGVFHTVIKQMCENGTKRLERFNVHAKYGVQLLVLT